MYRLLFIHPDTKLHGIYKKFLTGHFQVDSAYDGLSGLRLIKSFQPDVIVSEFNLPVISGSGLLKFVREHPQIHTTPFLFLSNNQVNFDGLNLGANDWLVSRRVNPEIVAQKCMHHLKNQIYV